MSRSKKEQTCRIYENESKAYSNISLQAGTHFSFMRNVLDEGIRKIIVQKLKHRSSSE
jgi:hypothetical protein